MAVTRHLALLLTCIGMCALARAGDVVDRMVANVNGRILLQSDWEQELALESLLNGRSPDSFTSTERKATLDRLIDQELLREQVGPAESIPPEQLTSRLAEVRRLYTEAATDQGWHAVLQRHGLSEQAVMKRLAENVQLMRSVEARLRPSIQIDPQAVESYYQERLLPELKKAGGKEVALAEVIGHIRELLAQQKLNQLLSNWLASLRSESRIEMRAPVAGEQSP